VAELILDQVLKRKKLSKRQFAKRIGKDYPTVFRYFRKGYDPKLSTLTLWARAIGVKVSALYRE